MGIPGIEDELTKLSETPKRRGDHLQTIDFQGQCEIQGGHILLSTLTVSVVNFYIDWT